MTVLAAAGFASNAGLLLICLTAGVALASNEQERLAITAPPTGSATHCPSTNLLKRQESCQFGQCGEDCLSQGAFCCGPAGTLATSPYWVCDNGACITSVRGTTGVVDCYDPDNPSGTTQSCIDLQATTTCKPTDKCFTCDSDAPFCRWETYIASNAPTLSWFSCVETRLADVTFLAATITSHSSSTGRTSSHETHPSSSASTSTSSAALTSTSASSSEHSSGLSTGAIIGIAVGGGVAVLGTLAILAYWCFKNRKPAGSRPPELATTQRIGAHRDSLPVPPDPVEIDSRQYTRSELNSTTAYSPQSQPNTLFTPPDDRTQNVEEINLWRARAANEMGKLSNR